MIIELEQFIERLGRFNFEAEQLKIIEENKYKLERFQAVQWSNSKDKDDKEIKLRDNAIFGFGYRPFTVRQKKLHGSGLGRITDHVTLFQTGDLYRSLFATITGQEFKISSNVWYFTELMQRTGDVTGLNVEMRTRFAEEIVLPGIIKAFNQKVWLIV